MSERTSIPELSPLEQRIAQLESELAATRGELTTTRGRLAEAESTIERLRGQYTRALEQLQLMRRRLFVAKSERVDSSAEQLAFDQMFEQVQALEKALDAAEGGQGQGPKGKDDGRKHRASPPTGRRDLSKMALPFERVEVLDDELEATAKRIGFDTSYLLAHKRGGMFRVELAVASYKKLPAEDGAQTEAVVDGVTESGPEDAEVVAHQPADGIEAPAEVTAHESTDVAEAPAGVASAPHVETAKGRIVTAARPKMLLRRAMLAPSMIAHLLVAKYVMGVPFYRLEQRLTFEGCPLDRGTMSRYAEDIGASLGAIVEAARQEAIAGAFCLSTDATGASIQPAPLGDGGRQACRKGHFFVTLADCDHVFFDYQPKHNSQAVWEMFRGFSGHIQADAHSVYDALFRGTPPKGVDQDSATAAPPPTEVGCWSHARRRFWEATVCKHRVGLEGLRRIDAIFDADRRLCNLPPQKRKLQRDASVRPLVDAFFTWAKTQHEGRGLVASALGYALRQEQPLRRFLDDGRLKMTNNAAERALRTIAVGRKAWLFFGSDDHANAAANLYSLFAGCKLHRLDPEDYLAEVIRVMPYWPRERYLELAPKYWAQTRVRLRPKELEKPVGHVTVPPPLSAEEQQASR